MRRRFYFGGITVHAIDLDHAKKFLKEKYPTISDDRIFNGVEADYDKVFTYFPIEEIMEDDVPYIYDHKRKGKEDEVASLSLRRASKYESFKKNESSLDFPLISFWYG